MAQAIQALGELVSPCWSAAQIIAGAVQQAAVALRRVLTSTLGRVSVPRISDAWLCEHQAQSFKQGDEL